MTPSVLSGVVFAWGIAQVAVGVFFSLVFALGRRDRDYLLFGLTCFALALTSIGIATGSLGGTADDWLRSAKLAHVGIIAATVFNFHFALRYGAPGSARPVVGVAYLLAAAFELANALDYWWEPGTAQVHRRELLGGSLFHGSAAPTPLAVANYVLTGVALLATQALFLRAYRRGNREALIAFVGGLFVCGGGANDILTVTGVARGFAFLQPHAFMLYAFAIASTLVLRYRRAAGELANAESHLRQAAEELRVSHAELLEVQSTLETKEQLAVVGELAASIAHEVRNPLAVITNAVAGLRRAAAGSEDQRVLLDIVDEEAERLNHLVTNLLRFARPAKLHLAPVDLGELAESVAASAGAKVEVEVGSEPVRVEADEALLRVALENLVANAQQACSASERVTLRVGDGDGRPSIGVSDEGAGMDEQVVARACDPFFTTKPSGTGLGLAIVQRIARAHGGALELESAVGRGTTARIVFARSLEAGRA